jgi:hypothetical protein
MRRAFAVIRRRDAVELKRKGSDNRRARGV